jgi:hypothetical protein
MGFTVSTLVSESAAKIQYKHNAAVTAWTPIYVSGLGPIIPVVNAEANQLCVYYRFGVFKFTVADSIAIAAGDAVYYNSASRVVQKTPPAPGTGFYLGKAVSSGTGNPTGTVSVEVSLNDNPPIDSDFESDNITTTGNVSCANVVASGDITCDDLTSSGIVASTSSQVIGIAKVKEVNTTAELTAGDVIGGIIKSTPAANIDITLPGAADLLALVPGAVVGTTVKFKVVNCATETHSVTIVASNSITNGGVAAHLGVAAATAASFEIVFTNVTAGEEAAVLYRG